MFDYDNYNRLNSLESTGTQFVNTGVKVAENTAAEIDLMFTEAFSYNMSMGVWPCFSISTMSGSTVCAAVGGGQVNPLSGDSRLYPGERYLIKLDPAIKGFSINGADPIVIADTTANTTVDPMMTIFGAVDSGTFIRTGENIPYAWGGTYAKMKLYSCKIYSGSTLIRDYTPAQRRSDSVLGLYDSVDGVFYTNQGTDTFIADYSQGGGETV